MFRALIFSLILFNYSLLSLEKLPEKYCVSFGDPKAKNIVTEYFSFTCPSCIALFKKEFENVKENLIDENKVCWIFHPIPVNLQTIQAMICLEKLSPQEKCLFLDAILGEADLEDPSITSQLMQKAMEVLRKPVSQLQDKDFISQTNAFQDAFLFLKQDEEIARIPAVEINGRFFLEIPESSFVKNHLLEEKNS